MSYKKIVTGFMNLVSDHEFFVFDTETTGLGVENSDIIEFSALRVHMVNGCFEIVEKTDIFINPGYHIPDEVTKINGIDDAKVAGCPSIEEAALMVYKILGPYPILVGYNSVSFDQKFLAKLYSSIGKEIAPKFHLDVLKMAKELCPRPHKLIDMANCAGIAEGLTFHTSIDDAIATLGVMEYLLPMYSEMKEKDLNGFKVTGVKRWTKSHTLDRLYISNNLNVSAFYDMYHKEWVVEEADTDVVKAAVYQFVGVSSDEELRKTM